MKDYNSFPPIDLLKRVLTNCPQSALIYIILWHYKKASKRILVKKEKVKKELKTSPTIFKNRLQFLSRDELISFEETPESFLVDLHG